jgi:hypothetical protein
MVCPMDDLGAPSSYVALGPGVEVYSRDGDRVGEVKHVLADVDADIFEGIVIDAGGPRFADASLVADIYERGVVLSVATAEAERLPEPTDNPGTLEVRGVGDVDRSQLAEKLRRAWEIVSGEGVDKG